MWQSSDFRAQIFRKLGAIRSALLSFAILALALVPACTSDHSNDDLPTLGGGLDGTNDPGGDVFGGASVIGFSVEPAFCCSPLKLVFTAVIPETSPTAGVTFLWTFGDGRTAVGSTVEHAYPWARDYEVTLVALRPNGESESVTRVLTLSIDDSGGSQVVVTPADPSQPDGNGSTSAPGGVQSDAGPDQTVTSGDLVILDGSNSHGTGTQPLRYNWFQAAGTPVELSDVERPVVNFTAPTVQTEPEMLVFVLVISQGGAEDLDYVNILVEPSILVAEETSPPEVFDLNVTLSGLQTTTLTLSGLDADSDNLSFFIVDPPSRGNLSAINNAAVSSAFVDYTPDPGFAGADTFTFRATDGSSDSNLGRVTISVVGEGRPPEARDASWLGRMNTSVVVTMNAEDDDGDTLQFLMDDPPTSGTLGPIVSTGAQTATVVFLPDPGYEGTVTFRFRVSDGEFVSPPASVSIDVRKVLLPWLEVNLPENPATDFYTAAEGALPGMTLLDYAVSGLDIWNDVTDQAIITTLMGNVPYVFGPLEQQKPAGMKIYGGFKTSFMPGMAPYIPSIYNFAHAPSWQLIADAAEQVVAATGTNVVILENETALTPYYDLGATIDYEALKLALVPLRDTGIEVWWALPNIHRGWAQFPDAHTETTAFVTAIVEAVPNSKFLISYTGWYYWEPDDEGLLRQDMAIAVGEGRLQDGMYVTDTGWWERDDEPDTRTPDPEGAISTMGTLGGTVARIYPPGWDWILVAEEFANLLPPRAPVP